MLPNKPPQPGLETNKPSLHQTQGGSDWSKVCAGLKQIYTSANLNAAEAEFDVFRQQWEAKYPAMIKVWTDAWAEFIPFLDLPEEVRQLVYTTNAIESLNARFRKAVARRGHFPSDDAALKVLYLTAIERRKNRRNPTGQINGWKRILNMLTMHYQDRITAVS